jgi:hypothetical protein
METYEEGIVRKTTEEIEAMIDSVGLSDMVSIMSDICYAKAEHLRSNWQDEHNAEIWVRAGTVLNSASGRKAINRMVCGHD